MSNTVILHKRELYRENYGNVIWWKVPVTEPPYVGTPDDDDFPEYATHFAALPLPAEAGEGPAVPSPVLPKDDWAQCPCCGVGRDPMDTRSRCRSRRGLFGQNRCDKPEGHGGVLHHSTYRSGGSLGWSIDEKDCACGLCLGHPGECYKEES